MTSFQDLMQPNKEALFNLFKSLEGNIANSMQSLPNKLNKKSAIHSDKTRKEGNELFKSSKTDEINKHTFLKYTASIAYAPKDSEKLALAFGNRSALLLHALKLEESIQDIDRALSITNSNSLKIKLRCRKVECLKMLGKSETQKILNEAISLVSEFKEGSTEREFYDKLIEKAKGNFEIYKKCVKEIEKVITSDSVLHENRKKKVNNFSSVLLDYDKEFGRLLRASKDIRTGEIVLIERMYTSVPNWERHLQICNHCLLMTWSTIPCDNCSWAMYCSDNCKTTAWEKYHNFECSIVSHENESHGCKECSVPLRMFIMGIQEAGNLSNLKKELEEGNECIS